MSKSWIVLKTQPRNERLAAQAVRARGVESYLPILRPWRSTERPVPLFPGYLFAHVVPSSDDVLRIRSAPGVAHTLPRNTPPALLPDAVVAALRLRLAQAEEMARQPLRQGDRVAVVAGPFRWAHALFDCHLNASGRVRILLELVHRTVALDLDEDYLQRVG